MADLPEGWKVEGIWTSGDYFKSSEVDITDGNIGDADAIIVSWSGSGSDDYIEYVTLHGADDYESLAHLIEDIDVDSYFA